MRITVLTLAVILASCASQPRLGADYAADEHAAVESDAGKLIIYREASDAWRNIFYRISIDGTRIGELSDGGFLSITAVPGNHSVAVALSLRSFNLPQLLMPLPSVPRADPRSYPRPTKLNVDIKAGAVSFLRLSHRLTDGIASKCGESEETIQICRSPQRAFAVLEDAPVEQAQAELATLRESIQ